MDLVFCKKLFDRKALHPKLKKTHKALPVLAALP